MKIDLSDKPVHYTLCSTNECENRRNCLHWLAYDNLADLKTGTFYSPKHLSSLPAPCPYYADATPIRYACGFKFVFDEIPGKLSAPLRSRLKSHFGAYNYYRYMRGEFLLPLDAQEYIRQTVKELGYPNPIIFKNTTERHYWGDYRIRSTAKKQPDAVPTFRKDE